MKKKLLIAATFVVFAAVCFVLRCAFTAQAVSKDSPFAYSNFYPAGLIETLAAFGGMGLVGGLTLLLFRLIWTPENKEKEKNDRID